MSKLRFNFFFVRNTSNCQPIQSCNMIGPTSVSRENLISNSKISRAKKPLTETKGRNAASGIQINRDQRNSRARGNCICQCRYKAIWKLMLRCSSSLRSFFARKSRKKISPVPAGYTLERYLFSLGNASRGSNFITITQSRCLVL